METWVFQTPGKFLIPISVSPQLTPTVLILKATFPSQVTGSGFLFLSVFPLLPLEHSPSLSPLLESAVSPLFSPH